MAAATASSSDNFAEDDFWCVGASVFAALVLLAVSALGAVSFSDVGAVFFTFSLAAGAGVSVLS